MSEPKYRSRTPPKGKRSKSRSTGPAIAEVSADIAGGMGGSSSAGGAGGDTMRGTGPAGSHRSYVARRFLEDEGDDLDMEPEAVDLMGDDDSSHRASGTGGNIFDRRDNRAVDQSVNLMAMGGDAGYEKKSRRSRPRGGLQRGKQGTSMVDVFLDYATNDGSPGQRGKVGDLNKSRKSKCKALVSSTRFLIILVGIIVAILIVVFAVIGGSKSDDKPKEAASSNTKDTDNSRLGFIQSKIAASGATSQADLTNTRSYPFKAIQWLTDEDEAKLSPNDPGLIQRYVAAVLYLSTQPAGRPDPFFSSWVNTDKWMSKANVCDWHGIECEDIEKQKAIVHFNLTANQLQGTIPSELKALTYLTELDLSGNHLTGTMPDAIGKLTALKFLMLQDNRLVGSLPVSFGDMADLEEIFLSNNQLVGPLTEDVGLLEHLRGLRVDHNLLTGTLPKDWKQKGFNILRVNDCKFSGRIPHQLFQLTTLVDFRLGNNQLTGTIPPEIESIFRLEVFEAHKNNFDGTIPEVFDRLDHLKEIKLHNNAFKGPLPRSFGKAAVLESVQLNSNSFTGSVPEEWAEATLLRHLLLNDNLITGTMPTTICDLKDQNQLEKLEATCNDVMKCDCCTTCY